MRISIVTPGLGQPVGGNRVTAERWAAFLREAGHEVTISAACVGEATDLLIAIHADKSAASIERFHELAPTHPIVVVLAGTDHDDGVLPSTRPTVCRSLELATRIVVLQPLAADAVNRSWRPKLRCILQSALAAPADRTPRADCFEVAVLAHLRTVKDPLLAARAARLLPTGSRVLVSHAGAALEPELQHEALAEAASNPRYHWWGPLGHEAALALLARSRAMVLSSRAEGGANVISEAVAHRVPILAARIRGTVGILGADYPGYFEVGDAPALAAMMLAIERDSGVRARLREHLERIAPALAPEREREAIAALLAEILPA